MKNGAARFALSESNRSTFESGSYRNNFSSEGLGCVPSAVARA